MGQKGALVKPPVVTEKTSRPHRGRTVSGGLWRQNEERTGGLCPALSPQRVQGEGLVSGFLKEGHRLLTRL